MSDILERIAKLSPKRLALLAADLQAKLDALERARTEPIAIVGMGCRFPGATDPATFWKLLDDGVDAISEVPSERWNVDACYDPDPDAPGMISTRFGGFLPQVDQFDAGFFGISPREAMSMDPQQRLLLEVSWQALEDAGQAPDQLTGTRTGVFLGVCNSDYYQLVMAGDPRSLDAYVASGGSHSVAAGRLSYVLGLQGPSLAVDTACSSSLVAVHLACQSLRSGESRLALAGGVNLVITPDVTMLLSRARMLAPDGRCKTFDARADGFVRGEGCGVVVLKRLADAQADGDRVLALIRGTAVNQDGRSNGLTAPNGPAQEAVIREALAAAGVAPHEIGYVEAHGTGTSLGDPIELQALGAVLSVERPRHDPVLVGSVKTNIGHLEAAAGVAGLIKVVLAMQHDRVPRHLHFETPNPHIPWSRLPVQIATTATPFPLRNGRRLAGLSSFGFSGTNAHAVLEAAPHCVAPQVERDRPLHVLALSARGDEALRTMATRLASYLESNPAKLADVCFSTAAGHAHLPDRVAMVVGSVDEARGGLAAVGRGDTPPAAVRGRTGHAKPSPVFLFTGQGAQYAGMGRELYETEPRFRAILDRCDALLRSHLDQPLLSVLFPAPGAPNLIDHTAYTQPALFALEYALCELWRAWGITPAAVMGHSVGEYVAACVAGALSLEDGLRLIAERGRLMQSLPAGAMVAVLAEEDRVIAALGAEASQVAIAAVNGPEHIVLSGASAALGSVVARLTAAGVECRALAVSHAFHSPMMEPILSAFEARVGELHVGRARVRIVSNLTGRPISGDELANPAYWARHLREPVRFADGVRALHALGHSVFVEIGPTPTLLGMAARCVPDGTSTWLPSLRRGRSDWSSLLGSLATLFAQGATVDWKGLDHPYTRRRLSLPTYPFQGGRHWVEGAASDQPRPKRPAVAGPDPVPEQQAELDSWLYAIDWTPRARPDAASWLPDLDALASQLAVSAQRVRREHYLDSYGELLPELDQMCAAYMARALGAELRPFQRISVDTLMAQLGVVGQHRRLLRRMLEVLEEDNLLRAEAAGWTVRSALPTVEPNPAALAGRFPEWRAQIEMSARCGARLGDVLRGDCDPLQLLFPDGGLDDAERLYTESPFARAYNTLVAETVAAAARALPPGRVLRILEIGAGTGGTTAAVLARLSAASTEYVFTDVSAVFTLRATEKFRDHSFVQTALLDIEQDPARQGLAGQRFDVVLAANVLHATSDLRRTLRHVRELLAPEGMLVLLEATAPQRFGDLTVGLTEGWWRFADADLRPGYALLSRERWAALLSEEGFTDIGLVPAAGGDPGILAHQALILARAPAQTDTTGTRARWLILCDESGVGERLASRLESHGDECVLVRAGTSNERAGGRAQIIDPARPEALQQLLRDVASTTVSYRGVVHLWGLDAPAAIADLDAAALARSVGTALHLAQGLAAAVPTTAAPPRLWLVTRGAQPAGEQGPLATAQAPLWGLGTVIALEHPELRCTRLDLDPMGEPDRAAATLYAELRADDPEDQVAVRGQTRYVARLRRATLPASAVRTAVPACPAEAPRIGPDGSYLITGGLSGLGLRTARWLVERGARHLILVGRRAPSPAALATIAELRAVGSQVMVEAADVACRDDVARVLGRIRGELQPLRGVFHAAGVLDDGVLSRQRWERFAAVLAPKVLGAVNLEALTQDLDLDLFVLFSSGASMLGSAGQSNHAAANAFLDALAHDRRARGACSLSINWGPWKEIGAAASSELGERMVSHGMGTMTPTEGIRALEAILRRPPGAQVGVLPIDWPVYIQQFGAGKEPPLLAAFRREALAEGPLASSGDPESTLRARLADAAPSQRQALLLSHVLESIRKLLRFADADAIDLDQPLVELGIDSLMALELRNALVRAAGCPLPATLLFDCPTPRALTRLLADRLLDGASPPAADHATARRVTASIEECSEEELALLLSQKLDALNGGSPR